MPRQKQTGDFRFPNPGVNWDWLINILVAALSVIIPVITRGIRDQLQKLLDDLYKKAHETANPWDDYLISLLMRICGFTPPQ